MKLPIDKPEIPLTVGYLLSMIKHLPEDTPIEFLKSYSQLEHLSCTDAYIKTVFPLIGGDNKSHTSVSIVLL